MVDMLVKHDPKEVLEGAKRILEGNRSLPKNCPKKSCLSLGTIILNRHDEVVVYINSNPPQLPTKNPDRNWEIHPTCERQCQIGGNYNRHFVVIQSSKTGEVERAEGDWNR